jgi:hypothetical protein
MENELIVDKLTAKELEDAREALIQLYEAKKEYAKAKHLLRSIEIRMAQFYDRVNHFLKHVKPKEAN